jgi:hypothetical protein
MRGFGRAARRLSGSHPSERRLGDDVILLAPAHTYSGLGPSSVQHKVTESIITCLNSAGQPADNEAGRAFVGPALPRAPAAWCPLGGWGPFFPKTKEGDPKAALKLHRYIVRPQLGTRQAIQSTRLRIPAPDCCRARRLVVDQRTVWRACRLSGLPSAIRLAAAGHFAPASWAAFLAATFYCVHA